MGSTVRGRPPSSGSHSSPRTRPAHDAEAGSGTCVHGEPPRMSGRTGRKKRDEKSIKGGWVLRFSPTGRCGVDLWQFFALSESWADGEHGVLARRWTMLVFLPLKLPFKIIKPMLL